MKLILTFTNKLMSLDFQMSDDINIREALHIISENSGFRVDTEVKYIYSKRKKQKINTNYTFKQVNIYSGDELIVEEKEYE